MHTDQKQIIENYVDAYNSFNVEGMINDLSDDMVFENFSNGKSELRIEGKEAFMHQAGRAKNCLLYTSPSPRDATLSRMPSSA